MNKLLEVSDVVKMLRVPKGTIFRWIKQGDIPCIERNGIYIFNKSTLETWAASKNILLKKKQFNDTINEKNVNSYSSALIEAIFAGNVFKNINCSSVENFFLEIPKHIKFSNKFETYLPDLLTKREKLGTTSIGSGIAIPHPINLLGNKISKSMIATFFLKKHLDFDSADKIPVFVAFVLMSKNSSEHLDLLSKLTQFINYSETIDFLRKSPSLEKLIDQIQKTLAENI